ncbi:MAG: hypothetical protein A3F90_16285 [Deltaproteobacteria bacterium RIFCSPLOWO2_12_FULL_60_19]|jgi:hypothetical protein|nr:MAG: hypothetical protein A3F90_16285 [Deltaproteobacteria bacterium RIFCSPLOWO2_12_FULL_60_19]
MKLSVKGLMVAAGIVWALTFFVVAYANLQWPPYGKAFLDLMSSIYPGYKTAVGLQGVLVGTGYALVDGAIAGMIFGWLYNGVTK